MLQIRIEANQELQADSKIDLQYFWRVNTRFSSKMLIGDGNSAQATHLPTQLLTLNFVLRFALRTVRKTVKFASFGRESVNVFEEGQLHITVHLKHEEKYREYVLHLSHLRCDNIGPSQILLFKDAEKQFSVVQHQLEFPIVPIVGNRCSVILWDLKSEVSVLEIDIADLKEGAHAIRAGKQLFLLCIQSTAHRKMGSVRFQARMSQFGVAQVLAQTQCQLSAPDRYFCELAVPNNNEVFTNNQAIDEYQFFTICSTVDEACDADRCITKRQTLDLVVSPDSNPSVSRSGENAVSVCTPTIISMLQGVPSPAANAPAEHAEDKPAADDCKPKLPSQAPQSSKNKLSDLDEIIQKCPSAVHEDISNQKCPNIQDTNVDQHLQHVGSKKAPFDHKMSKRSDCEMNQLKSPEKTLTKFTLNHQLLQPKDQETSAKVDKDDFQAPSVGKHQQLLDKSKQEITIDEPAAVSGGFGVQNLETQSWTNEQRKNDIPREIIRKRESNNVSNVPVYKQPAKQQKIKLLKLSTAQDLVTTTPDRAAANKSEQSLPSQNVEHIIAPKQPVVKPDHDSKRNNGDTDEFDNSSPKDPGDRQRHSAPNSQLSYEAVKSPELQHQTRAAAAESESLNHNALSAPIPSVRSRKQSYSNALSQFSSTLKQSGHTLEKHTKKHQKRADLSSSIKSGGMHLSNGRMTYSADLPELRLQDLVAVKAPKMACARRCERIVGVDSLKIPEISVPNNAIRLPNGAVVYAEAGDTPRVIMQLLCLRGSRFEVERRELTDWEAVNIEGRLVPRPKNVQKPSVQKYAFQTSQTLLASQTQCQTQRNAQQSRRKAAKQAVKSATSQSEAQEPVTELIPPQITDAEQILVRDQLKSIKSSFTCENVEFQNRFAQKPMTLTMCTPNHLKESIVDGFD